MEITSESKERMMEYNEREDVETEGEKNKDCLRVEGGEVRTPKKVYHA